MGELHMLKPVEEAIDGLSNLDAEAAILGFCMIDNDSAREIARIIEPSHFSAPIHGRIFEAILAAVAENRSANPVTLKAHFDGDEDLRELGGVSYLMQLTGDTSTAFMDARELAGEIRDLYARRFIRDNLRETVSLVSDPLQSTASIVALADEALKAAPVNLAGSKMPGLIDLTAWQDGKAPYRQFILEGWIASGSASLLSGQEGVGKSLIAQQLATCAATGRDFLGMQIDPCHALYITCEDPIEELQRRQDDINKALGLKMRDLAGKLDLVSLKGEIGNEFGTYDSEGRLHISPRYRQVTQLAKEKGSRLVFIDNAAHVYPGNENDRHQVATFLGLLERLSEEIDGSVILLAHPNKEHGRGNTKGNEYSGSTGWSAHVRSRLFIDWASKDADGNVIGEDGRVLRKSKANYGKKGEEIYFRWHEWAFVIDDDLPDEAREQLRETSRANFENECFLACLRQRLSEKRPVSEKKGANYAPRIFSTMPEARGCTKDELEAALDRLYRLGEIEVGFLYRDPINRRDVMGLREKGRAAE